MMALVLMPKPITIVTELASMTMTTMGYVMNWKPLAAQIHLLVISVLKPRTMMVLANICHAVVVRMLQLVTTTLMPCTMTEAVST